jgi:mycothiol system anti-sigma-R factor
MQEDCRQTLTELQMFLDGELPQEHQQQVLDHLHECLECYHAYDFQAELKQIIAAKCANEPLPPGLLDRIKQSFRA